MSRSPGALYTTAINLYIYIRAADTGGLGRRESFVVGAQTLVLRGGLIVLAGSNVTFSYSLRFKERERKRQPVPLRSPVFGGRRWKEK